MIGTRVGKGTSIKTNERTIFRFPGSQPVSFGKKDLESLEREEYVIGQPDENS